jgi:predicted amidohydrolase
MKVAAVQMVSRLGDVDYNVTHGEELIREGVGQGARLLALPEFALCGSITEALERDTFALAQTSDGPAIAHFRGLARELGVWLCVPLFEREVEGEDRFFNAMIAIDRRGEIAARYRKRFVPNRRANEKYFFSPGNLPSPVWDVDAARFGVNICFERQFIETSRIPALKGADVLVHLNHTWMSAEGRPSAEWPAQAQTMARLNSIWVLAACATHAPGQPGPGGGSAVVNPRGEVVAQLDDAEGVLVADIEPRAAREARAQARMLCELRADVLNEMLACIGDSKTVPA